MSALILNALIHIQYFCAAATNFSVKPLPEGRQTVAEDYQNDRAVITSTNLPLQLKVSGYLLTIIWMCFFIWGTFIIPVHTNTCRSTQPLTFGTSAVSQMLLAVIVSNIFIPSAAGQLTPARVSEKLVMLKGVDIIQFQWEFLDIA